VITGARVVVSQLESNLVTAAHVLRTARRAGARTVLNPAPMRPDFDLRLLKHVDILIPNETEFTALVNRIPTTGRTDFSEAELAELSAGALHRLCRQLGVPVVIVTLGARGCLVSQPESHAFLPAYAVKAVDTTGAGDAFVGGFAAGLVKFNGDVEAAARFGNAVAALSVTRFGTAPSMPTSREITRFLKNADRR
jgi:ribokinase